MNEIHDLIDKALPSKLIMTKKISKLIQPQEKDREYCINEDVVNLLVLYNFNIKTNDGH